MECNQCNKAHDYDRFAGMPLANAYVPWQNFEHVMDAQKGLNHGTIFAELVMPFYGAKAACCRKRGMYESE